MLSRLNIYQESGPITDARVVVVLRTGNTGFPNVAPYLFMEKDVGVCSHTFKLDTTAVFSISLTLSLTSESRTTLLTKTKGVN